MAWAEGTVSGWVGAGAHPLGGCLLLCGLCRRKLLVSPRDLPRDLGPRYMSGESPVQDSLPHPLTLGQGPSTTHPPVPP
ncbi:unnamed protein product [Lepidochelys kempii]